MKLSPRVQNLKASAGFELLKLAQEMKARGEDVISLAIGELQGKTYASLRQAGAKAIEEGWTKYSPSAGQAPLRKKLAQQASLQWGLNVETDNVLVSHGVKYALYTIFQCLCSKGDEVLLPAPYWMSYPPLISLSGADIKVIPTKAETGFKIQPEDLESAIKPKSKIFVLNSPNNPSSAVYSKSELKALADVLKKYPELLIVLDSIYDRLVYDQKALAPHLLALCPELKDRVFALNGASKAYLMTGWRLGWLIGPKDYVKVFSNFQSQSLGCVNSMAQRAFETAGPLCEPDIAQTLKQRKKIRDLLIKHLKTIPELDLYPSKGAFYLWVGVQKAIGKKHQGQTLNSSRDIMQKLLQQHKLLCLCGEEFGMPGYLRLSYVLDEGPIQEAGNRIKKFFSLLT